HAFREKREQSFRRVLRNEKLAFDPLKRIPGDALTCGSDFRGSHSFSPVPAPGYERVTLLFVQPGSNGHAMAASLSNASFVPKRFDRIEKRRFPRRPD